MSNQIDHDNIASTNEENFYDLSATLIERRKRLHELANEINKWEDDSACKILSNQSNSNTSAQNYQFNHPPPLSFNSYNSPKQFKSNNSSPAQNINKENHSYLMNSVKKQATVITSNSNEIISVANRILTKKISNTNLNETNQQSLVKTIKSKFENTVNSNSNLKPSQTKSDEQLDDMTPKSIIKKFELMSREKSSSSLTKNKTSSSAINISTTKSDCTPLTIKPTSSISNVNNEMNRIQQKTNDKNSLKLLDESSIINTDNIKPKSIIEKFESLVKSSNSNQRKNNQQTNSTCYSASLTYVSSMSGSPSESEDFESNNLPQFQRNSCYIDEIPIYEEIGQKDINRNNTSLFEDSTEEESQPTFDNQETYSLSASSYTGSLINQEEFEEHDDDDQEYTEEDEEEYDSINDLESYETNEITMDSNEVTIKQSPNKISYSADLSSLPCTSTDVGSSSTESYKTQSCENSIPNENLFSIKEYRKQKKTFSGRRSSIMPKKDFSLSSANSSSNNNKNIKSVKSNHLNDDLIDEKNRKIKNLERIKELEDLIKQEDNVIHQTGIALERCINDSQFTGTNEHIECNRILLISCQKRQAYSAEINRLKYLISELAQTQSNSSKNDSKSSNDSTDISQSDLTGLLIFSDLQLPIKESYINKLKNGDEKRIFYFLCLIRNGIQVLQTQVISVQELISTKDTSLIFPNRMAINNVDINFKVKIDIYTLEVLPKDTKPSKQTLVSGSTKFFSPFKFQLSSSSHNNHHGSSSNSNYGTYSSSNHHFNEQSNLSSHGAKTSNFIHIDTIEITQSDISKNKFKLNISSSSIPLTGILYVNVRCMPSKSIELKGFMSLFEDSSTVGFGTWDRRWCFLNNYNISYWRYPDDEFRNGPLGVINLTKCINDKVSILPRDLCARKYSIELTILDENVNNNTNNNTIQSEDKCKRYRLSADSKEQASDWVTNINFALANLRLWNPSKQK